MKNWKGFLLERIIGELVIIIVILFPDYYQTRILSSNEAAIKAVEILQDPPKEWKNPYVVLNDIKPEGVHAQLSTQEGILNELTNRQQWEITIKYQGVEPTIVLDAYTGKIININGPVN